jgi:hypothetical protein
VPLHAMVASAKRGNADLVLHDERAEVDAHSIWRAHSVGEFLSVDDERDACVIESRVNGQLDNALEFAFRLVPATEKKLGGGLGRSRQEDGQIEWKEWRTPVPSTVKLRRPHKSADTRNGSW